MIRRLWLLGLLALGTPALAAEVRFKIDDAGLRQIVGAALQGLSSPQDPYTLVGGEGVQFAPGGAPAFNPDLVSRSFAGSGSTAEGRRIEFNPQNSAAFPDAARVEVARVLGLKRPAVAATPAPASAPAAQTPAPPSPPATAGAAPAAPPKSAGTDAAPSPSVATPPVAPADAAKGDAARAAPAQPVSATPSAGPAAVTLQTPAQTAPVKPATPPAPAPVRAGPADLNGDGRVDLSDLAILMGNYGKTGKDLPGDLNGDGKVDDADIRLFSQSYTQP